MILLDTNILLALMKAKANLKLVARMAYVPQEEIFISAMTRSEILYGLQLKHGLPASKTQRIRLVLRLFDDRCLDFDSDTAAILAEIRAEGIGRGAQLPLSDAIVAATALQHNLELLTVNIKDFKGIPQLKMSSPL